MLSGGFFMPKLFALGAIKARCGLEIKVFGGRKLLILWADKRCNQHRI